MKTFFDLCKDDIVYFLFTEGDNIRLEVDIVISNEYQYTPPIRESLNLRLELDTLLELSNYRGSRKIYIINSNNKFQSESGTSNEGLILFSDKIAMEDYILKNF